jgi:hypothetical protein
VQAGKRLQDAQGSGPELSWWKLRWLVANRPCSAQAEPRQSRLGNQLGPHPLPFDNPAPGGPSDLVTPKIKQHVNSVISPSIAREADAAAPSAEPRKIATFNISQEARQTRRISLRRQEIRDHMSKPSRLSVPLYLVSWIYG